MKDRHERELMEFTGSDEEKRLLEVRQRNQVEEYLTLEPVCLCTQCSYGGIWDENLIN